MTPGVAVSAKRKRSAARLAVVQALYELDVSGTSTDTVIAAFLKDRWLESVSDPAMVEFDAAHFAEVVRAVAERRIALDLAVSEALAEKLQVERLEVLLRSIFRAGAYELSARHDIPTSVVINEYLEVAHAFFSGKEPALVNAVLDRLAKSMGRGDAAATQPADSAESDEDAGARKDPATASAGKLPGDDRAG